MRRRTRGTTLVLFVAWLVFLTILAGIVLGASEVGLRIRRGRVATTMVDPPNEDERFVDNPLLRYTHRPSYSYTSTSTNGAVLHYTTASLGFRGAETTVDKPAGVRRVVLVGGSTVYGALDDAPDTLGV